MDRLEAVVVPLSPSLVCVMLLYGCDSSDVVCTVAVPTPTVRFTRFTLGSLYVGLNFTWRCEVDLPGDQLAGVRAAVDWRGPSDDIMTSDNRITVGRVVETSPGRSFQREVMFSPLSVGDAGSYSCTGTVMPTVMNSNVMNGVGTLNDSLTVASKLLRVSVMV